MSSTVKSLSSLVAFLFFVLATYIPTSSGFDYYVLAAQWPAGKCMQPGSRCYSRYPNHFTVHGLWPALYGGANVPPGTNWHSAKDLMRILQQSTIQYLIRLWPQLLNRGLAHPNYEFWAYEWNKHGSASNLTEDMYFQAATGSLQTLDLMYLLRRGGVTPGAFYRGARIQRAAGGTGLNARPICYLDRNGQYALVEIRVCLDLAISFMRCPRRSNFWDSCGGSGNNWVRFHA